SAAGCSTRTTSAWPKGRPGTSRPRPRPEPLPAGPRRTGMRRIAAPLATLLLAVALGACADGDGGPRDPGSPTPPASSPGSPSPDPGSPSPRPSDTPRPPMPTASPPPGQPVLTLTGRVYAGVETGCQLLEYGGTEYLLVWQGGRLPTDR